MQPYSSKSGKQSGVTAYKIGDDYIIVQFGHEGIYKYSYSSAGKEVVEAMKERAIFSEGLSTYISKHDPPFE